MIEWIVDRDDDLIEYDDTGQTMNNPIALYKDSFSDRPLVSKGALVSPTSVQCRGPVKGTVFFVAS